MSTKHKIQIFNFLPSAFRNMYHKIHFLPSYTFFLRKSQNRRHFHKWLPFFRWGAAISSSLGSKNNSSIYLRPFFIQCFLCFNLLTILSVVSFFPVFYAHKLSTAYLLLGSRLRHALRSFYFWGHLHCQICPVLDKLCFWQQNIQTYC